VKNYFVFILSILLILISCDQLDQLNDITPPSEIIDLTINGTDTQVTISWTNPTDSDFDHTEIWYGENNTSIQFSGNVEPTGTVISTI